MRKEYSLSLFVSSFIFFIAAYLSALLPAYPFIAFLLLTLAALYKLLGRNPALVFAASSVVYFLLLGVEHIATLFLHMSFTSFAVYFLWEHKDALIRGCGSLPRRLLLGIALFIIMVAAALFANALSFFAGVSDQAQIVDVVSSLPLYLIIISFTLGPISEELFFRAMLVPRAGVIISTILFTATHAAYGSIAELAGAFVLGLVLAVAYKRLKDPLPCIVAHMLFNLVSITLMFWVYG